MRLMACLATLLLALYPNIGHAELRREVLQEAWEDCRAKGGGFTSAYRLAVDCGGLFDLQEQAMDHAIERVRIALASSNEWYSRFAEMETLLDSQAAYQSYKEVACKPWEMLDGSIHQIILMSCIWYLGQDRLELLEGVARSNQ